jgi:hypothetical protein
MLFLNVNYLTTVRQFTFESRDIITFKFTATVDTLEWSRMATAIGVKLDRQTPERVGDVI